jgi:amidase
LNRRGFVERVGILAATLGVVPLLPAQAEPALIRRTRCPADRALELAEATFSDLADGMASGRLTSRQIVDAYLARIEAIDRTGPSINAILELNPDATRIADALDVERTERGPRSPLHGIPILVKDDIGTADRMHTSAGSLALASSIAPRDAFVVEKLRDAGCVILGKANMSEWANARGRSSVGGWSGRGRLTHNPYVLDRSAGGSSSGTAAAVSANLAPAALGTETMGSIISPASLCGVVGVKPTVGLVSRAGTIPVSITQDTVGPVCRTVRDAAMLLSAISGPDPRDPATSAIPSGLDRNYTKALDPTSLKGARIGVARNLFGGSAVADRVANRAIEAIRGAGAVIVDNANIETAEAIWTFDSEVLSFEIKATLNAYLASLGPSSPVRSLTDLIEFDNRNVDREMEWFGQETFLYAQSKGSIDSPEYAATLATVRKLARDQGIDATLAKHNVEALVAPAQSPAWITDVLLGDNNNVATYTTSAAAGYPSLTVPAGDVSGLPVGLLFMGAAWSEARLLGLAFAFEQLVQARRTPEFLATIQVRP